MQYRKNKNSIYSIILMVSFFATPFLFSCNNKQVEVQTEPVEDLTDNQSEDDGFGEFYVKFHRDSAYQMEHITFPLQGLPMMADSNLIENGTFFYKKPGWKILKEVNWDTATNFVRTLEPTGLGIVNEFICTHDHFCISRRFAKLHDGWYLVYYADLNYRGGM